MSDFDTPEGWREVPSADIKPGQRYLRVIDSQLSVRPDRPRYFVREEPVPPLPTERFTVIRVDWRDSQRIGARVLFNINGWYDPVLHEKVCDLDEKITGFEVLAKPVVQDPEGHYEGRAMCGVTNPAPGSVAYCVDGRSVLGTAAPGRRRASPWPQLEAGGWYPRKLIDGTGLRYNPEHGRHRQVVIDLRYPPNENRLEFLRNHTQLPLELPVNEKGEG